MGVVEFVKIKSIRKLKRKRDVYCIGTKFNGTMIANGIITKNCDALRYALKGFLGNRSSFGVENISFDQDFGKTLGYRQNRF